MRLSLETLRRYLIYIVPAIAIFGLAAVLYVYFSPIPTHHVDSAIRKIGFSPLTPPTNLRGPGTIYVVDSDGHPHSALCEVPPKLLTDVLQRSDTETQVAQEFRKASFAIDSEIERSLKASVKGGVIESVTFSFEDVSVHEISIANLRMLSREMQKSEFCADAVEEYLKAGRHVCQGQQALKATAKYSIKMHRNAETSVAVDAIREAVRATIDPKAEFDGSRVTSGLGLFYGIRLAPLCHYLPNSSPARAPLTLLSKALNWLNL